MPRGLQIDVVYLGWPKAPSYMSPIAGGGGVARSQPMSTAVLYTGAQINFGDLTSNLTYGNAKCCYLKKLTCKGNLLHAFTSLLGFYLGWQGNFVPNLVRYRVLNYCRIRTPTQLNNPPPPPSHKLSVYNVLWLWKGGGGRWTREKFRGAIVHKAGSKIPTWLTVSPVYKHL